MVDGDSLGAGILSLLPMLSFPLFMVMIVVAGQYWWIAFVVYYPLMILSMRASRWIAKVMAGLVHHVKCRPTSRKEPYGWKWPGMFTYRWKRHPQTIGYLPHYRFQNGKVGGYVTRLQMSVWNRIVHPFYNRGGRLKAMFWIHEFPYDEQFAEDEDTVYYRGYNVKGISTVSWANLHEIMPSMEYFRDPKAWNRLKGKHNHVPYVEPDDLSHTPWFEVTDSSGMRAARESRAARFAQSQKVKVAMLSGPKGQTSQVPLCPECDKPLKVDNDVGTCENGHSWDMK
jgi:hypothetical protein